MAIRKQRREARLHVVESIYLSYYVGEKLGDTVLLADRLYLTVPALEELGLLNKNKGRRIELVTLAKSNAIVYEEPFHEGTEGKEQDKAQGHRCQAS